jgi:O-antigen/teichoic acid export membrane protein
VRKIARGLPMGRSAIAIAQVTMLRSVALALNACTGLITAAFLGPHGRGEQAALMLAPQVLAGVATLGMHASLIYNVKADPEHEREYVTLNLLLTVFAGIAAMAVGWFLVPIWLRQYDSHIVELARLFLLTLPLVTASFTFTGVLEAQSRFAAANRVVCFQTLLTLAVLGVLVGIKHLTPATAASTYAIASAFGCVYLGVLARYRPEMRIRAPLLLAGRLLSYGLRFYGVDVVGVTSSYLDQIIIAAMLPPAALGTYVVALSVSRLLNVLPASAETVLFPTLAARATKTITETIAAAVRILSTVNAGAAIVLVFIGPQLLTLLYGNRFAAASAPLVVLLIATVPANAAGLFYQSYSGCGRPGIVTIIHAVGLAAAFGAMLLFIPHYGTIGAALALLLGALVRLGGVLIGMPLVLGVRIPSLIVTRADLAWVRGR